MDITFKDFIEQLHLPTLKKWKVIREDNSTEKFKPLALFKSLVESEIPIDKAFEIYDETIKVLDKISGDKKFPYKSIQSIVVDVLLSYPENDSIQWIRNYQYFCTRLSLFFQ